MCTHQTCVCVVYREYTEVAQVKTTPLCNTGEVAKLAFRAPACCWRWQLPQV